MNRNKMKYLFIAIIIVVISMAFISKCSNKSKNDIEDDNKSASNILEMSTEEQKILARDIVKAIVNNDFSEVKNKMYLLDSQCYYDLTRYASSSEISNGNMSEIVVEHVPVEKSSTADDVLICNTKIWFDDASYNMIYTFEFHVNAEGFIYGYNIWVH